MKEETRKILEDFFFQEDGDKVSAPTLGQIQEAYECWKAGGFDNSDRLFAEMVWLNYMTTEGVSA